MGSIPVKVPLEVDDSKIKITANTSFIIINDKAYQLQNNVFQRKEEYYVPLDDLLTLLTQQTNTDYSMDYASMSISLGSVIQNIPIVETTDLNKEKKQNNSQFDRLIPNKTKENIIFIPEDTTNNKNFFFQGKALDKIGGFFNSSAVKLIYAGKLSVMVDKSLSVNKLNKTRDVARLPSNLPVPISVFSLNNNSYATIDRFVS
mgnify:CR=1 FL=1